MLQLSTAVECGLKGQRLSANPTFSPDGSRLIFQYNDIAQNNVVSYELNGQNGLNYGIGHQPSWGISH